MRLWMFFIMAFFLGCKNTDVSSGKLRVVTTTNIISDLVYQIAGDAIELEHLMVSGVDPHLYKASEGDVMKLYNADIIFYNGLHLEGKMGDVFSKIEGKQKIISLGDFLPKAELIASESFGGNYDPHVWFDIQLIHQFVEKITEELSASDPKNAEIYRKNKKTYQQELTALDKNLQEIIAAIPPEKRILITAHDAFSYFGKSYDFEVRGLQGISTITEAGVQDVRNLSNFIVTHQIKAIFVENSVPRRTIEALQAAVRAQGHDVAIGGTLYSDSLGNPGTDEGTYIGMYRYNVETIVNALR
ncbi:MAG: zinc ABC transporter solute-binding protein [Bacteroidetes bacterium]|jgi:manganese/zinc/iron transport system substrate-binding protein|nr:zinc ABC transporter solute-binding protein [Bacteroidota bacterium]